LRIGRHFRLDTGDRVIVGRNQDGNEKLLSIKGEADIVFEVKDHPGPITIIPNSASEEAIAEAAAICVRYSDAPRGEEVTVICHRGEEIYTLPAKASLEEELDRLRI